MADANDRFWSKVAAVGECWEWTAERNNDGYGRFWQDGRKVLAHRWSFEQMVAPIPSGLEIDHLCFNRGCVNPAHLDAVSPIVNRRRRQRPGRPYVRVTPAVRTHCGRGHELTPENTRIRTGNRRACRTCIRAQRAAHRARQRARD